MIGVFYLLLIVLVFLVYKKAAVDPFDTGISHKKGLLIWCIIYVSLGVAAFWGGGEACDIYVAQAGIFTLMAMVCVWGSFFWLMIPLFVAGVLIYPGFFLLGVPLIIGVAGYQGRLRSSLRLLGPVGILAGGAACYIRMNHPYTMMPVLPDPKWGLVELLIYMLLLSPYIALYIRLLWEVDWDPKYAVFLSAGILVLPGYFIGDAGGKSIYFMLAFYMLSTIFPVIWRDAVWIQAVKKLLGGIAASPIGIILVIYAFLLFPCGEDGICALSRLLMGIGIINK